MPSVVVFDVNETLSDMAPMADRFNQVGAPSLLAKVWFAALLRDGFALTAAGAQERFAVLAAGQLRTVLAGVELDRPVDTAVAHILDGFTHLPVHPDVPDGVRALRATGRRLVTLTNGAADIAEQLLTRAGVRAEFEHLLSVEQAPAWKPARAAYEYAATACGTRPADLLLVAVHPWDIDGAARAGLHTAWLNRTHARYPDYFTPPEHTVATVGELADRLAG
ncbi:haloacid dehalogenase type II [Actinophytocola sp.]|uniref:haloacid dehalogenase type II n=1 Tax=Actinophytocola sp. TaxID=1872138 RepID=UPI002D7EAAC7|nr:haloacid dehalogenase type II [Actinophytocola sp.]HET9142451.1 haloacid dehalogenase type II [Actinophytocola sp.]